MTATRVFSTQLESIVNDTGTTTVALAPVSQYGGRLRVITSTMEVATTSFDEVGDIIVIARLPATAVINSMLFSCDALDTGSTLAVDLGTYETNGTVVDADAFASAYAGFQSIILPISAVDLRYEAAVDPVDMSMTIWEAGGESTSPGGVMRDIAFTITTVSATPVVATLSWTIIYSVD